MDKSVGKSGEDDDIIIGIDLGTTYSCVAVYRHDRVEIIASDHSHRITPSFVAFTREGDRLIGDAAKNQIASNLESSVFDVKRLIGRNWDDTSVQQDIKCYPFKVFGKNNKPYIELKTAEGEKVFAPEEISAMVLGNMKAVAEKYLGKKIKKAVVTVPAYFNWQQRRATLDAGSISGLDVVRILSEPTAAAIAYGLDKKEGQFNILVFDLGGGTFDVSLVSIDNGNFRVRATSGDTHLGGEDFDRRVVDHFISLYSEKKGKDIKNNPRAIQRLRQEVEKCKRVLSSTPQVRLHIDSFVNGEDFSELLSRAKFEELNMDLFNKTLIPVKQVLKDAELQVEDVKEVLLVGGSTRIPKIMELVKEHFKEKIPSLDINPDEAVAHGAAVCAAMLTGKMKKSAFKLEDITPLTLSTDVEGDIAKTMIPRNTPIPKTLSSNFTTSKDDQTAMRIQICEGERPMVKDNHFLGVFMLTGIEPAPRGVAQVEITFEVDADGILTVTSEDKQNGNRNGIVINSNELYLSTSDIEQMKIDAEKYAEEDKKRLAKAQARNKLESCLYSARKMVKDISAGVDKVMSWMNTVSGADADGYNAKLKELQALLSDTKH